jgi:curved DNA-binding protein CbpA
MKNYYDILGVKKDANTKEIKASYRKLVKKWHPDLQQNAKNQHLKTFEQITAAYNTLIRKEKRKQYDLTLAGKKTVIPLIHFQFREWKEWLFSLSWIKMILARKKIAQNVDPSLMNLSIEDLLERLIYSHNIYVQTHAARAIIAKKKRYAIYDLLRLLYSNIHEMVKVEIIQGLSAAPEAKIMPVIREIYEIEKNIAVKQAIRKNYSI